MCTQHCVEYTLRFLVSLFLPLCTLFFNSQLLFLALFQAVFRFSTFLVPSADVLNTKSLIQRARGRGEALARPRATTPRAQRPLRHHL